MHMLRRAAPCLASIALAGTVWAEGPTYSWEEVARHRSEETGIWVVYRDGVYDVTSFVEQHPGGQDKIMLAAGGSVAPFWAMYRQHEQQLVQDILAEHRIGDIESLQPPGQTVEDTDDPYRFEPKRHPALDVKIQKPFNAETPTALIPDAFITSNDLFFVRNHLPVPNVDMNSYKLVLCSDRDTNGLPLCLEDLKSKFDKVEVTSVIQCAGNRRKDMSDYEPVKGTPWTKGAISNAQWGGARLKDVLLSSGIDLAGAKHVQFEGCDSDLEGNCYGASIPLSKVMDDTADVLLAYEMNGEPIPLDHGFPVRVVVPGVIGARNVKWVKKVVVSKEESQSHWQRQDYKSFNSSVGFSDANYDTSRSIQEFPVQSAICEPQAGSSIDADQESIPVKGYAVSGGGREIIRVDVSGDGGETWHEAKLMFSEGTAMDKYYAWTLWEADIPVTKEMQDSGVTLTVKAVDASYNEQPRSMKDIWNIRGLLSTAWHCVPLTVEA